MSTHDKDSSLLSENQSMNPMGSALDHHTGTSSLPPPPSGLEAPSQLMAAPPSLPGQTAAKGGDQDVVQRQEAPPENQEGEAQTAAPSGETDDRLSRFINNSNFHGMDRSQWPIAEQIRFEMDGWNDSGGAGRVAELLGHAHAISDEGERTQVLALLQEYFPEGEEGVDPTMGILLRSFVQGGGAAAAEGENAEQADQTFRQGGFDAMAAYISNRTTVRRTPSSYHYTEDSLRLSQNPEVMEALHRMGYFEDMDRRVVNAAMQEHELWEGENGRQRTESDPEMRPHLDRYWGTTRGDAGAHSMGGISANNHPTLGYWSAVFISHVMDNAGAGDTFASSDSHVNFALAAQQNGGPGQNLNTHPFRLYNAQGPHPEAVHVGGLIHRNRPGTDVDIEHISGGSHSDIVVGMEVYRTGTVPGNAPQYSSYEALEQAAVAALPQAQSSGLDEAGRQSAVEQFMEANDLRLFAVTVGGNTRDEEAPNINIPGSEGVQPNNNNRVSNTVGRRYFALNPNRTVDHARVRNNFEIYGVQRLEHPE